MDEAGAAYITGTTNSGDFPTTIGAYQTTAIDGFGDVFVVKLNSAGTGLVYGTFIGGGSGEGGYGIAVDSFGNAYVAGWTGSGIGAASGSDVEFSTFLGGSSQDFGVGIALGTPGVFYVTGYTRSIDFPVSSGAVDPTPGFSLSTPSEYVQDAFVTKINLVENPDVTVSPSSFAYPSTCVGLTSAAMTTTVTNNGNANLSLGSITGPSLPFSMASDGCSGQTLVPTPAAGSSCAITVQFAPTSVGPVTGSFNIPSNDPDENPVTVSLSGTGIAADIDVNPTSYDFGNLCPAGSLSQSFTVSNVATSCNLSITSATGLGAPFGVTADTCSGASLAPGASCGVSVQFAPISYGSFSDSLVIASDDPDEATVNVGVTGATPPPDITVSPASYNFGDVCTGATATQMISVTNSPTPSCPLNIAAVGSPVLPFSLIADSCTGASLPASGSCSITAQFAPTATGFAASAFGITSNDPDESPFGGFLSGTGITGADLIGAFTSISRVVRGGPRPHRVTADVQVSNITPCGIGAGGSTVSLYLSSDPTFDPGDTFLDQNNVGPIAAGAARTTTFRVQFASNPQGQFLIAVVDSGGVIMETNEGNNTALVLIP